MMKPKELIDVDEYGNMKRPNPDYYPTDLGVEVTAKDEGFHITDDDKANWYVRKLFEYEVAIKQVTMQMNKEIERLTVSRNGLVAAFGEEFRYFCEGKLDKSPTNHRSIIFSYGTARFRKVPASVKVANEEAAMEHAPDLVIKKEVFDKSEYNKRAMAALKEDGVLLPGIAVMEAHDSFSMDLNLT